jgi:AAA15 family ATPase/GTPase
MRIKSIELKDFKTYENIIINCDTSFNVIIGPNNIGKSTIIEGILLWEECLKLFIQGRNNKKLYIGTKDRYLGFSSLFFLRISNDSDLFFSNKKSTSVCLNLENNNIIYSLKFNIGKPESIKDSYFKVNYKNSGLDFEKLSSFLEDKDLTYNNIFYTYQTKPISQIVKNEPFYNNGQILKKISLGKSNELIRNKILKSKTRNSQIVSEKFKYLETKLKNILETDFQIKWKNNNLTDDEFVKISIKPNNTKEVDLSLMGSGFLQILEIFSTIQFISNRMNCLNVILIDEPDSHIHSNLQVNLLNELLIEENIQVFIITHNENLIHSVTEKGSILFINEEIKKLGEVNKSSKETFDFIKNQLSAKLLAINKKPGIKNYVISEDENIQLVKSFFKIHGYKENETEYISYFGCDNIGSAVVIGNYILKLNKDANITIHRDRDYLTDEEIEIIRLKVEKNGFTFFTTIGVDIESNFINSNHINTLYPQLAIEDINNLIGEVTTETERDSIDRILKRYAIQKKSGIEILDMYHDNKERFRYGKKVFSRLKGKIQPLIGENPNFLRESDSITIDKLKLKQSV